MKIFFFHVNFRPILYRNVMAASIFRGTVFSENDRNSDILSEYENKNSGGMQVGEMVS